MSKSPLIRKISRAHLLLSRYMHDVLRNDELGTAILVNSFPKSGTHLLSQLFENGNLVKDFGYFLNNASSWKFTERSESEVHKMVAAIKSGELVRGHLWYSKEVSRLLTHNSVNTYFIYRDLRDVVVSEAFYLTKMNRWHALHKHFHKFNRDISSAIKLSIEGLPDGGESGLYTDIGKRFLPFTGWLSDPHTCSVSFESLRDLNLRHEQIVRIFKHYQPEIAQIDFVVNNAISNIDPENSHTYRSGKSGQWRNYFTGEHKELFKAKAGELLIQLGYESDSDW